MDVHARSITLASLDTETGEVSRGRLTGSPGAAEVSAWARERCGGRDPARLRERAHGVRARQGALRVGRHGVRRGRRVDDGPLPAREAHEVRPTRRRRRPARDLLPRAHLLLRLGPERRGGARPRPGARADGRRARPRGGQAEGVLAAAEARLPLGREVRLGEAQALLDAGPRRVDGLPPPGPPRPGAPRPAPRRRRPAGARRRRPARGRPGDGLRAEVEALRRLDRDAQGRRLPGGAARGRGVRRLLAVHVGEEGSRAGWGACRRTGRAGRRRPAAA